MDSASLVQHYVGPVTVTLAYVVTYYAFLLWQAKTKFRLASEYKARGEKFDRYFGNDREMLAADRVVGNTLEQMPPFLAALWLHAVFASPSSATAAGVVYLLARGSYPLLMGGTLGRAIPRRLLVSTFTGYGVVFYLLAGTALAAAGYRP